MRKIIIDCDPGHDDAIAICLALAYKDVLSIEGITTVGGNQTIENVTNNALKIVELLNEEIEVSKGSTGPLIRKLRTAPEAHGVTGMDGPVLSNPTKNVNPKFAVEYIASLLRKSKEKITLVALGPLTNIALLIKTYPDILNKIEEISLMGGGINSGNVTSAAEFNIYVDPEAAKIVFESGLPIAMSGLDVTNRAFMLREEFQTLKNGGKIAVFVYDLLEFYFRYSEEKGYKGGSIHDACAVMYLIKPEIFDYKRYHIDVCTTEDHLRGRTKACTNTNGAREVFTKVLLDVDREEFVNTLIDSINTLDSNINSSK